MRSKIVLVAVLILIVLVLVLPPLYSFYNSLPQASYKIGDEIKSFPIDGMSITVTNFSISSANIEKNVIVNVTIRNLASSDIYFNQSDILTKLREAVSKYLVLDYRAKFPQSPRSESGEISPEFQTTYADWWGIAVSGVPRNEFNWLGANKRVNGSILFVAPGGNFTYTSFSLVCKQVLQQKPLFAVSLAQG